MYENKNSLQLNLVPAEIREPLRLFTEKLAVPLADNLISLTVVGSSLTKDFKTGRSDINTVIVLGKRTMVALNAIASLAKPMSKKKISPPVLMTESYIERSLDVFGVEFLDFQLTHKTILGNDPFSSLSFDKKDVRLQCERELKATLIRLRQGYIAAAANRKLVRDILISTAKTMAPLLRAMLWLKNVDRPNTSSATFARAAAEFSANLAPVMRTDEWRYKRARVSQTEIQNIFEALYIAIEQLADTVDKLEV
jgi:hypothetical protein